MYLQVVVRISISNHRPFGKLKKPEPRHNEPCLWQLVRYKLYEIRLDTLEKTALCSYRTEPTIIFAFPFAIVKSSFRNFRAKRIHPLTLHINNNIVTDFSQNFKEFSEYYSSLLSQSVGFFHCSRNFMTSWIQIRRKLFLRNSDLAAQLDNSVCKAHTLHTSFA